VPCSSFREKRDEMMCVRTSSEDGGRGGPDML
jgi:hypothetical protein